MPKNISMSQEDALGWPDDKPSQSKIIRPVNDLLGVKNINKRIDDYTKSGMSEPDAIKNTAGDKSRAENRPYNPGPIQNNNPQGKVFSSGSTENLKANNGHPFL